MAPRTAQGVVANFPDTAPAKPANGSNRPEADIPALAESNMLPLFEPASQFEPDRQFDPTVRDVRGSLRRHGLRHGLIGEVKRKRRNS